MNLHHSQANTLTQRSPGGQSFRSPTTTKGFIDSSHLFPGVLISCWLSSLLLSDLYPFCPLYLELGKTNEKSPLFLPCLAASRSAGILLPTALCAAGEGRAPLRGGSLRRAIPGLAAEVLRKSQLHCTEDKRGPEIKVFLQVLLASPGAQALCLPNFDTPPPTRSL